MKELIITINIQPDEYGNAKSQHTLPGELNVCMAIDLLTKVSDGLKHLLKQKAKAQFSRSESEEPTEQAMEEYIYSLKVEDLV
ncbi:hypothetical protein [Mucilaginibacter sp.]